MTTKTLQKQVKDLKAVIEAQATLIRELQNLVATLNVQRDLAEKDLQSEYEDQAGASL